MSLLEHGIKPLMYLMFWLGSPHVCLRQQEEPGNTQRRREQQQEEQRRRRRAVRRPTASTSI